MKIRSGWIPGDGFLITPHRAFPPVLGSGQVTQGGPGHGRFVICFGGQGEVGDGAIPVAGISFVFAKKGLGFGKNLGLRGKEDQRV